MLGTDELTKLADRVVVNWGLRLRRRGWSVAKCCQLREAAILAEEVEKRIVQDGKMERIFEAHYPYSLTPKRT